ncbi:protocadherin beta-15-like isoform X1 [Pristis pectinata]|uniref:protocadherin beta-15-like isoform X1 n=1 Tax=Pristis pectinata TaxID=685728 RepID=UPI00223D7DBE|nr:protocadherin beta-15-like isoform X1 [Pristis pectinata]
MACLRNNQLRRWAVIYMLLVSVSDVVCEKIRYSIPEELDIGAFVGNIATDLGLDAKYLMERKLQILSESKAQYIDVNKNTGTLFVKEKIDREQLCGQSLSCALTLEAVLENPLKLHRVEIEILDVNDNEPVFQRSEINLEISEMTMVGTSFPLQSAQDPDSGSNGIRSYQLNPNEHFALKFLPGGEQSGIPELVLEKSLDREQKATHQLTLTAFDEGNPQKIGTSRIKITVLDVNDNAPVCEPNVQQIAVAENVPHNTLIAKVTAVDLDEGLNGELIYSLNNDTPEKVRNVFGLDPLIGEIRVIGNVDFEETEIYQISVQVKDRGSHPLLAYCKIMIMVTDVNDNSPEIMVTTMSSNVPENISTDTAIALLRVSDRDSENSADILCRITNGIPFKLNSSLNSFYMLVTHGALDREIVPEYNITVTCTDTGSPPLSSSKTVHVLVTDINDNAPRFTQPSFTMHVRENNAVGDSIGSVSAVDADSNKNSEMTFVILDRLIQGLPASSFVSINDASGVIFAERSFDFEELKQIQLQVQVRDAGFPPLCNNVTVNVIIVDQNDNAPLIVSPMSNKGSVIEEIIPRSADTGYLVTKVTATDADSGQNAELSYQLHQPTDESLFTIAHETGEIWTIRRFVHKDTPRQKIVVVVKDNGSPCLSSTVTISALVQDDTAEKSSRLGSFQIPGLLQYDLKFYLIIAFGSASFVFLVAIIILGIKVQKGRVESNSFCCCWNMSNFSRRDSLHGIQKASVNLQIPRNYSEVYQGETFSKPFRYEICSDPPLNDFMFLKSHGSSAPRISNKNGLRVSDKHIQSSNSTNKDPTEFHEICGNRQWDLEQSSMEGCPSGQNTLAKNQVEPEQRSFLEIHSHAL